MGRQQRDQLPGDPEHALGGLAVGVVGHARLLSAGRTAPAPAAAAWTSVSPPLWCQTFAITVVSPVAPHADTISTPW